MSRRDSKTHTKHLRHGDNSDRGVQEHVSTYFDSSTPNWDAVYRGAGLQDVIYQQRQGAVLEYVYAASLPPGSAALEIICGGGELALALVTRGLRVVAVGASPAMVDAAAQRVRDAEPPGSRFRPRGRPPAVAEQPPASRVSDARFRTTVFPGTAGDERVAEYQRERAAAVACRRGHAGPEVVRVALSCPCHQARWVGHLEPSTSRGRSSSNACGRSFAMTGHPDPMGQCLRRADASVWGQAQLGQWR